MGSLIPLPHASTPAQRILRRFSRDELSGFISVAIDLLDLADGDVDAELNGDELDGNGSEEDFVNHGANWLGHPGCPVSDPGACQVEGEI